MSFQTNARLKEGIEHQKAERFQQAADAFTEVLKADPKNVDAMHFLGLALWQTTHQPEEALKLVRKSIALAPGDWAKHHNIGAILGSLGQIDEAIGFYRKAIELNPQYAEAFFNLAGVYKFKDGDPAIAAMQTLYAANNLDDPDQEFLVYALAKAMNDTKNYYEAFHFALEGARLKKPDYNVAGIETGLAEMHEALTEKALTPVEGRGHDSDAPVFIVGMPRSGTTLVETILSRHREVFAAGELPMMGSINTQMRHFAKTRLNFSGTANGFLPLMPHDHFAAAAQTCLKMVDDRANGQKFKRFTDKMPSNAFQIGLISMMFPKARVIHVMRHPLDTCISCFFQRFRVGHPYSYRLDWLGAYYRFYAQTMAHWRKVMPLPMLEVRYEDLVSNPEEYSRKLVDFVGVEWDEACLNPQDADRSVMTASRWQVRQPIYKSSLNRWKRYEPFIQPLVEGLGGWEWIENHVDLQAG